MPTLGMSKCMHLLAAMQCMHGHGRRMRNSGVTRIYSCHAGLLSWRSAGRPELQAAATARCQHRTWQQCRMRCSHRALSSLHRTPAVHRMPHKARPHPLTHKFCKHWTGD